MKEILRKLSSRKLWVAIVGIIVGVAAAFGINESEYMAITGVVTSASAVVAYIVGEAKIDAARISNDQNQDIE